MHLFRAQIYKKKQIALVGRALKHFGK